MTGQTPEPRHYELVEGSVAEHIIDTLGPDFMYKVSETLGGLELKVPKSLATLHADHRLVQALGMEDAARLCEAFAGEKISIPMGKPRLRAPRCADYLTEAVRRKMPIADMAQELGFSMRHVRRMLQQMGLRGAYEGSLGAPVTAELWRERESIVRAYLSGALDKRDAVTESRVRRDTFNKWVATLRRKGTLVPDHLRPADQKTSPLTHPNAGLCGHEGISGVQAPPQPRNARRERLKSILPKGTP